MRDPAKSPLFKHLKDAQGRWAVREDVWVRYKPEHGPVKAGPLTLGFTVYGGRHHFGPELQLGHVLGDYFDNQVLLIKTAWGGKSLYRDFRPPSSGGTVGPYYTKMLTDVREALAELKTDFPNYDGGGYELSGFVWYQGWNDGCDPKAAVPEYERNLVNLIRDVRRGLEAPDLPVVIGEASSNAYTNIPCDPINYVNLLTRANANAIGYLIWAWYEDGQCGQNMNITVGSNGVTLPTSANPVY